MDKLHASSMRRCVQQNEKQKLVPICENNSKQFLLYYFIISENEIENVETNLV